MSHVRLFLLPVLGLAAVAYFFARPPAISAGGIDFTAFYCGAATLASGKDPYVYEPLHSCEHEHRSWPNAKDVVPAPLPPYALAILTPISRLPYPQAGFLWFLLIIASFTVVTAWILQLTNLRLLLVGPSVTMAVLIQGLPTGSLAPMVLALLCGAAVALARQRWTAAAILLGFACLEPHVTLPALLATAILVPQMRLRIVGVCAFLLVLTIVSGGIALNVEYATRALPAHAASELGSVVQFSLSSMLRNFGLSPGISVAVGSAQYAIFVLTAIWLASPFRCKAPAMVVLVPMAFAVVGGTYIHLSQIAAVLPLAFVVASETETAFAWAGIVLLSIPWNLLNAFTPAALTVPRVSVVAEGVLLQRFVPGSLGYVANTLVYVGILCVISSFLLSRGHAGKQH